MFFNRTISLTTAFIFFVQTVCFSAPLTVEAPLLPDSNQSGIEASGISRITIPSEFGTVEDEFISAGGKGLLVHIQNAHGSYEAQKNIQKILGLLADRYGFNILFLEGAEEKLDPGLFHFFKNNEMNLKVADVLMKHGEFTGAEMFLLEKNPPQTASSVEAHGIENTEAYLKDLELFRGVLRSRGKTEAFIGRLGRSADLLESRLFSNALRDFMKEWRRYREGRMDLLDFLGFLEKKCGDFLSVNLSDPKYQDSYGAVLRVLKLRQVEKKIDRKKAEEEKERLAGFLKGKVADGLFQEFQALDLFSSAAGNPDPRFLFERIHEKTFPLGLDFRDYPDFTLCAESLILQSEIESRLLFREIGVLTEALFEKLADKNEEKELVRLIQDMILLEKLLRLELSRDEYRTVLREKDLINPLALVRRMEGLAPVGFDLSADPAIASLFDEALEFYRLAVEREEYFIRKIEGVMNGKAENRSIIVTGGFHSGGIGEWLKGRGVSYLSVSPKIKTPGNSQEIYLRAMLGETRILESSEIEFPLQLNPKKTGRLVQAADRTLEAAVRLTLVEAGVEDAGDLTQKVLSGEREIDIPSAAADKIGTTVPERGPEAETSFARPGVNRSRVFAMAASLGGNMDFWTKIRFSSPVLSLRYLLEISSSLGVRMNFGRLALFFVAALYGICGCVRPGAVAEVGIISPAEAGSQADYGGRYVSVFSDEIPVSDLSGQVQIQQKFIRQILDRERAFYQGGIAFNGQSGLTYDGQVLDSQSMRPFGAPRPWSAPSKESLHISLLALSVQEAENAQMIVPKEAAKKILERKIASYERFNQAYPGFGGFLPWFEVSDSGLRPTGDWSNRVPALDNGQLAWSVYLAYHALEKAGEHDLAQRYKNYFDLLKANVRQVFYEGDGRIRGETQIANVKAKPAPGNYSLRNGGYFVADPYEGELMTFFMSLFGGLSDDEVQALWDAKRGELQPVEFETPEGPITVARGHYFSAHEKWKYLVLPYVDVDIARTIFVNGEKARTIYSAQNNIPGLMAAAHLPNPANPLQPSYAADFGIPELAKLPSRQNVVTPYAAFPVILAAQAEGNAGPGLLWLDQMLGLSRMQGPLGMSESFRVDAMDGKKITGEATPVVTWDVKGTTALALLGGTHRQIADALRADGKYDRFISIVRGEHERAFPAVHTANVPFGQFKAPLSSAEAQKSEQEAVREGLHATLAQVGEVPIVPDDPEASVRFFSAIRAMGTGERPFPDGTLLHAIGDDGICRVEEDPWHFLGRSVPEGMRIPGKDQGYHYAYLRVRAPAGDTEFRVEMKGFFSGKQVVSLRGKEWQWVEFKLTGSQDMYYFAISDVMRRFEVSDFWVSKGHFPGAQVQAYSARSLGSQRFWMSPGENLTFDLPGFVNRVQVVFNGFQDHREGVRSRGEFVFRAPGVLVLSLEDWMRIRGNAEAINRQVRTAGANSIYRLAMERGGKIVLYAPDTRSESLFDVKYPDRTQNRVRIRLTASSLGDHQTGAASLGEAILDEAVRMVPLNEETLAGELARIGNSEDIANLSQRIPRTVPEEARPVFRELLAGDFKAKVLEALRGKIRDGKVVNAVLRDETYAGYLNDETGPDSLAWAREDGSIIVLNKFYEYLAELRLKDSERAEGLLSALLIRLAVTDVLRQGLLTRHIAMTPAVQQAVRKFARLYEAQIAGPSALSGADTALNDFSRGFVNLNRLDRQAAFRRSEKFMRSQPSRAERVMDSFDRRLKALMDGYYKNREFYRRAGRETRNIADMRIKFWSAFEGIRGAFAAENFNGLSVRAVQAIDEIQDPDILGWKIQQYAERYEDVLRRMAECAGKDAKAERLERLNQEARDILSRLILMEMHPLRIEKFLSDPSVRPGSEAYHLVFARLWQLRYHMEAFARELMWQRVRASGRRELMRYVSESGNEDSIGDYLLSSAFFRGSAGDGTRVPEFLTAATGEVRGGGQYVRDTVQKLLAGGAIEYEMAGYRSRKIHYRASLNSLISPYWPAVGFREFLMDRLKDEGVRIRKPADRVVPGDILDALTSGKIYEEQLAGVILADAEAYLLSTAPNDETREAIQRDFDEKSGPDIAEVGEERVTYRYKHIFDLLRAFNGTLASYFRANETAYDMLGYLDDIQDRFKALKRGGLRNVPGVADARDNAWQAIRRDLSIVLQWAEAGDKPSRTMVADELLGAQLAVEFKDAERFERALSWARFLIENYIDENVRISKYTALKAMHVRDRIRRPVQILLKGARIYDAKQEIERIRDSFFPPRFDAPGYSRARARIRSVLERLNKMDGRTVLFTRDTARNNRIRERYVKLLVDLEMFLFDVIYKHVPDEEFAEIEPALRSEIEGRILDGRTMDQMTFSRETLRGLQARVAQTGASLGAIPDPIKNFIFWLSPETDRAEDFDLSAQRPGVKRQFSDFAASLAKDLAETEGASDEENETRKVDGASLNWIIRNLSADELPIRAMYQALPRAMERMREPAESMRNGGMGLFGGDDGGKYAMAELIKAFCGIAGMIPEDESDEALKAFFQAIDDNQAFPYGISWTGVGRMYISGVLDAMCDAFSPLIQKMPEELLPGLLSVLLNGLDLHHTDWTAEDYSALRIKAGKVILKIAKRVSKEERLGMAPFILRMITKQHDESRFLDDENEITSEILEVIVEGAEVNELLGLMAECLDVLIDYVLDGYLDRDVRVNMVRNRIADELCKIAGRIPPAEYHRIDSVFEQAYNLAMSREPRKDVLGRNLPGTYLPSYAIETVFGNVSYAMAAKALPEDRLPWLIAQLSSVLEKAGTDITAIGAILSIGDTLVEIAERGGEDSHEELISVILNAMARIGKGEGFYVAREAVAVEKRRPAFPGIAKRSLGQKLAAISTKLDRTIAPWKTMPYLGYLSPIERKIALSDVGRKLAALIAKLSVGEQLPLDRREYPEIAEALNNLFAVSGDANDSYLSLFLRYGNIEDVLEILRNPDRALIPDQLRNEGEQIKARYQRDKEGRERAEAEGPRPRISDRGGEDDFWTETAGLSLGEEFTDLAAWHDYFALLAKEAGKRAKKAEKKGEAYQPFKLILNVREADGNIAAEEVTFPSKKAYYENREMAIRYLALLVHVRGVLTGATEVAIDVSPSGAMRERIRHAIVRDVAEVLKREFGETGSFSSFGKWIKFNAIAKRLEADERVSEVSEKAPVDYSKGDAIGIDIGGTNIKLAVVRNGQELFTETVPVAGIEEPLGEYLEKRIDELAARFGVDAAKALYVTVPGPVTPAGAIVKITNLEESRPGTTDSLRAFQERRKNIRYQNDANTAAFYQMVMQGLSGNVILNTLGTGLGLGIIIDGKLIAGPQEAHVRAFFGESAVHHEGFNMNGDLESYANAEFVVRRTKELLADQGTPVPDNLTPRVVGEWLTMDKKDPLAKIARQVYREFGAHLAILYREIARVTGIHEWTVVFVGGIAKGKSGEEIIKGVEKAAGKKIKLNIKVGEEAEYTGALGAAYQGIQAGQIEAASLGQRIQRVLVMDDDDGMREMLPQFLELWDGTVEVVTAENGEEGMKLYRRALAGEDGQRPFDLVMTDMNMPKKTGFEAIREINPPDRTETVPVILMTGLSDNLPEARKLMESGQLRFAVSKPFKFDDDVRPLIETIHQELIEASAGSLGRENIEAAVAWVEEKLGGELWRKEVLREGFFDWGEAFKAGPIFVPRAVVPNEARMGMTPIGVEFLRRMGVENNIFVEAGSGINRYTGEIYFSDEEYRRAGAIVLEHDDFVEAAKEASQYVGSQKVVVSIKEPQESEYEILENALLFTYVHLAEPHAKELTEKLRAITNAVVAYETIMFREKTMWKTPVLAPASEGAGWVTAIRYANYVKHVKGRKVVDGRAVLDEATEALIRKNVQSYPDIPEDLKDALRGKKAMVFGGGIAGANCAMAMAKMGAYVYITEVNEDRIRELTEWFTSEGVMSRVEILKRPDPRHEKDLPRWIIEKLKECHAVVGAILVPGATAPVELTEDIYQQLMKAGRHFFLEDRLPSFVNLSPLEFLGDIAVDQGGNIAGTRPRKYEAGWVTAREVYLFGFKIVNETVVRILEAVQNVLNALFGMEAFNWVRRINWFTVTNMPSALPKQISMGLERAKLVYLLALLMGPEKAVEIFPELKPGFNILNGKITFDQVAKKHDLEYTPFEEAVAASLGNQEAALRELTELMALHPGIGDLYEKAHIGDYLTLTVKGYHGRGGKFVVEVIADVTAPGIDLNGTKIALIDNQTGEPAAVSKLNHVENTGYFLYFGKLDAGKTYRLELVIDEVKAQAQSSEDAKSLGEGQGEQKLRKELGEIAEDIDLLERLPKEAVSERMRIGKEISQGVHRVLSELYEADKGLKTIVGLPKENIFNGEIWLVAQTLLLKWLNSTEMADNVRLMYQCSDMFHDMFLVALHFNEEFLPDMARGLMRILKDPNAWDPYKKDVAFTLSRVLERVDVTLFSEVFYDLVEVYRGIASDNPGTRSRNYVDDEEELYRQLIGSVIPCFNEIIMRIPPVEFPAIIITILDLLSECKHYGNDCSAHNLGRWKNSPLRKIAERISEEYEFNVEEKESIVSGIVAVLDVLAVAREPGTSFVMYGKLENIWEILQNPNRALIPDQLRNEAARIKGLYARNEQIREEAEAEEPRPRSVPHDEEDFWAEGIRGQGQGKDSEEASSLGGPAAEGAGVKEILLGDLTREIKGMGKVLMLSNYSGEDRTEVFYVRESGEVYYSRAATKWEGGKGSPVITVPLRRLDPEITEDRELLANEKLKQFTRLFTENPRQLLLLAPVSYMQALVFPDGKAYPLHYEKEAAKPTLVDITDPLDAREYPALRDLKAVQDFLGKASAGSLGASFDEGEDIWRKVVIGESDADFWNLVGTYSPSDYQKLLNALDEIRLVLIRELLPDLNALRGFDKEDGYEGRRQKARVLVMQLYRARMRSVELKRKISDLHGKGDERDEKSRRITDAVKTAIESQLKKIGVKDARIAESGSTSRGFQRSDGRSDFDFQVNLRGDSAYRSVRDAYEAGIADLPNLPSSEVVIRKSKYNYSLKDGEGDDSEWLLGYYTVLYEGEEYEMEVAYFGDYYQYSYNMRAQDQLMQVERLGGDLNRIRDDVKRLKALAKKAGVYKEGHPVQGVSCEQLVLQSAERNNPDHGERNGFGMILSGVGSFRQALEWIVEAGLDGENVVPFEEAQRRLRVYFPSYDTGYTAMPDRKTALSQFLGREEDWEEFVREAEKVLEEEIRTERVIFSAGSLGARDPGLFAEMPGGEFDSLQPDAAVEAYVREQGRAAWWAVGGVMQTHERGGITEGIAFLPSAEQEVLKWFLAHFGLTPEAAGSNASEPVRLFNEGALTAAILENLDVEDPQGKFPLVVSIDGLFGEEAGGADEQVDLLAQRIGNRLKAGDLLIAVWSANETLGKKPKLVDRLYKVAAALNFKMRDVPQELFGAQVSRLVKAYEAPVLSISNLGDTMDLEVNLRGGAKIKFDVGDLLKNGIDLTEAIGLVRQLADEDPAKLALNFSRAGFQSPTAGSDYWQVSAGSLMILIQTAYEASRRIEVAA